MLATNYWKIIELIPQMIILIKNSFKIESH